MKRSCMTTLCYLETEDSYLMLHRIRKKEDVNKGKWIGVGGHFEEGESPEDCLLREVREETGLVLTSWRFRGLVTFTQEGYGTEYMCLYTADGFSGTLKDCDEGELCWVKKEELSRLNLWSGDLIFLDLLAREAPFFSLKLVYEGDLLRRAILDGKPLELFEVLDEKGNKTGQVKERGCVHRDGDWHATAHTWIARRHRDRWQVLLQLRSSKKDVYPGCFDISSAGHVDAGDGYQETALRELWEELGIAAGLEDLEFLTLRWGQTDQEFSGKRVVDREIAAVYLYTRPVAAETLRLQPEEVERVEWMDLELLEQHVRAQDPAFCVQMDEVDLLKKALRP